MATDFGQLVLKHQVVDSGFEIPCPDRRGRHLTGFLPATQEDVLLVRRKRGSIQTSVRSVRLEVLKGASIPQLRRVVLGSREQEGLLLVEAQAHHRPAVGLDSADFFSRVGVKHGNFAILIGSDDAFVQPEPRHSDDGRLRVRLGDDPQPRFRRFWCDEKVRERGTDKSR